MNQIGNIFRKDLRHHWREVAASLVLLVAFVWIELRRGNQQFATLAVDRDIFLDDLLPQLVIPLVPISWMFLVVRAVHGESLVGDRQFWVTRPYDWRKLASAKILFVLAFINLPLLLIDLFLLSKAGFSPFRYFPGLLWMQYMWIGLLVATAALASITASIGQLLLALLFIILYTIGVGILGNAIPNSNFGSNNGSLYFVLIGATAVAVLLLQYSRRRTAHSRGIIVGLGVLLALIIVATPYRTLIARNYPLGNASLHLELQPRQAPRPSDAMQSRDVVPLRLPFSPSGLPQDSFIELRGHDLVLTNSQGVKWDSEWESNGSLLLFPDQKTANIDIAVKRQVFDRMKDSRVHATLQLAFTEFHDAAKRSLVVPPEEFSLPELGLCSVQRNAMSGLICRIPPHQSPALLITAKATASSCPLAQGQKPAPPNEIGHTFLEPSSVGPGITPVNSREVDLAVWSDTDSGAYGICSGTALTLSNPEEVGHTRIELDLENLSLLDYQKSMATRYGTVQ